MQEFLKEFYYYGKIVRILYQFIVPKVITQHKISSKAMQTMQHRVPSDPD